MKKIIMGILFVLMISTMGIVVNGNRAERMIRVYGTITMDGEGVEGANIVVTNIDKGYEETTQTNSSGYYQVFIKAVDNNKIKVNVNFDECSNDKSFVLEKFKSNYEISFEFESTSDVKLVKKIYGFLQFLGGISLRGLMYDCLLFLLIVIFIIAICKWHKEMKVYK